ncbi:B-cell receptor CD22-like isoform X3 [Anguilla anguilla]|uniref:B-cell receptor CD22-like isoform X3 n=1 Tax=Anguilla anguilla TaxID=7936 RepID=UPI0015B1621A|nr:B-cell receptor CD22-like isoform X3 [Anguilla anguilla]
MISFWAMVLFLIGDSACSFSEMTAKEGSCVTFNFTLSGIGDPGYIVWLKDAVWNKEANDYEGTIVHSLKPDKHNASEFENRVSVGSTGNLHKLTISNLTLEDSGKYSVRYYDKPYPPYTVKKSSKPEMSLEVQKNPCQVSVTGPELVQAGAEVILRCSTVGPCQNSPEWRSSGPGLASSEGPDTQGAKTAQLRFEADWSHDGVEFSCWPSPSNEACASRNITLAVEYGPRGTKIRASCCQGGVKAGESLTLTCETNARPEPDGYTWFRTITEPGGQRGPRRTKVAVPSNGQSDGRDLRFWRISAGDAGEYTCQAKNIISAEKSTALRVDVLYGPTGLTMSMDHEAREYSLVTIHCSVESFPLSELTLTWAPPSSDRLSDLSQHPKRLQGKSTVQSTRTSLAASFNASVEHAGRYTCRASNSEGWKETTKDLVVHYAPKDVRATANPEGEVNEKTNLDLSCEARSNPGVAAYAWFKLTGRGAREVGQGPVLTLRYLSEEHTGQYLCRTQNKIGEGNSSVINVTVRYGPRKTRVIHNMTSRGRPVEGSTVALMCSSQSYPPIRSYMWHVQKDVNVETLLRPGQNLTIGSDEEGIYYCSAENEISSSSSDPIEIRFDHGPRGTKIKASCCEKGVKAGESLTLTCETNARPEPDGYTWFRTITEPGGQRGPGRTEVAVPSNGQSDGRYLRFWQISAGDAGEYTCQAKNTISAQNSTALRVDVLYPPKNTSVSVSPSGSVLEGSSVTLTCNSNANPAVQNYTWYKVNGTEMNTVGTGQNLTFNVTESSGSEQYYCEAQNEHGKENSTTVRLNVIYMPQISGSGSCSRTAAEISCSCESRGNPSPSMEWRVSGLRVTNSTERVIREEQLGNTGLRSSLTMRQSQGDTPSLLCVSTNTLGNSSLQLHVPSPQQHSGFLITSLLIGAAASAGAMMMICLIIQHILKKKRHSQRSGSRMKDSEGIILTDGTAAQDEESIYANKTMLSGAGAVEKGDEGALHYATVDFSKRPGTGGEHGTGIVQGTSKRTSDYTVIRHKSREEREGGEEEGEGAKEEVEKEGQAELGTEREWAEARGEKKEETTYGNICPSRPTKRARQGLQQLPRNPAAEEEQEEQRQEENSAGGQENMYVEAMSPLMEGNGKGTAECEYAVVRKPK